MGDAVCTVIRNYEALLMLTSSEDLLGDPTAIGLNQQLSSYLILALIHLSADVLSITNHLSKFFQSRDVCFSALYKKFDDSVTLEALREKNGPLLSAMENELTEEPLGIFKGTRINYTSKRGQPKQKELFQRVRLQFLDQLLENLKSHFPKIALLAAMQIFEPASYPCDENQLVEWGNQHLTTLLQHYGMSKKNDENVEYEAIIDPTACMGEFLPFKRLVFNNLGESRHNNTTKQDKWHFYTPPELMKKVFGGNMLTNQTILPVVFKLACLCLCLMVGNAEAE